LAKRRLLGNHQFSETQGKHKQTQAFTVNLGIASKRILTFENLACDRPPKEYQCCWRRRLAEMSPPETDRWWTVTSASTARMAGCSRKPAGKSASEDGSSDAR